MNLGKYGLALVLAAAIASPLRPPLAHADPTDPDTPSVGDVQAARDDADHAKTRVEKVNERLDAATAALDAASTRAARAAEAWNGARWKAQTARRAERRAVAAATRARQALTRHKRLYRDTVITVGTSAYDLSAAGSLLSAGDMQGLLQTQATNDQVQALLDQRYDDYTAASAKADKTRTAAEKATEDAENKLAAARTARDTARAAAADAATTAARIERRKTRLITSLARLQGVSVAVAQRRRDALDAARAAERAEAARTPVRAASSTPNDRTGSDSAPAASTPEATPDPEPNPEPTPQPARGAQAAIAFARAQIGEPYVWGAAGPSSWDCSGLTAKAWAAGGKYLPHYSVAQYDASTPISPGQLRPGDLVFWGSNGSPASIYHVALYVGDGMIIHAPRTGRDVTEESMYYWRTPDFYARP